MLISLPQLETEYSMSDYQDLFISSFDEHIPTDGCIDADVPREMSLDPMVLSDPESYMYTSTSESDMDGIPGRTRPPVGSKELSHVRTRSVVSLSVSEIQQEREIVLHSPGKLLNTPRDPSRKYEYPFPPNAIPQAYSSLLDDIAISVASTPGLISPGEILSVNWGGSVLGLSQFAQSIHGSTPPTALPTPILDPPVSTLPLPSKGSSEPVSLSIPATVNQVTIPVVGSLSNLAIASAAVATAHPKLSGFKLSDAPVPPKLRARSKKSASTSILQAQAPHLSSSTSAPPNSLKTPAS